MITSTNNSHLQLLSCNRPQCSIMAKSRKKKTPITRSTNINSSSSPHSSRTVIRQFHVLLKRRAQLQAPRTQAASDAKELADVENRIAELGGLERYQQMSFIGQGNDRGGGSEKVLIGWLKDRNMNSEGCSKLRCLPSLAKSHNSPLTGWSRLLEIGALKPDNYGPCSSWIDCTPMDLRSRHPSILEQDFLLLDENEHRASWDVISLSLVLNFVPEPKDRGTCDVGNQCGLYN